MTFPWFPLCIVKGDIVFFWGGRNDANMERERKKILVTKQPWQRNVMRRRHRSRKYGLRGSFSLIHHLPNYMKSRVNVAISSISQVPVSRLRLSGIISSEDAKWPSGRKGNHRPLWARCLDGIVHAGLGLTQILISQTTAVMPVPFTR